MSADFWVQIDTLSSESVNVTYNVGPMLRAAGFPDWDALVGASTAETLLMLREVGARIAADVTRFRNFDAPNGWGTVETTLRFLGDLALLCEQHPTGRIEASL